MARVSLAPFTETRSVHSPSPSCRISTRASRHLRRYATAQMQLTQSTAPADANATLPPRRAGSATACHHRPPSMRTACSHPVHTSEWRPSGSLRQLRRAGAGVGAGKHRPQLVLAPHTASTEHKAVAQQHSSLCTCSLSVFPPCQRSLAWQKCANPPMPAPAPSEWTVPAGETTVLTKLETGVHPVVCLPPIHPETPWTKILRRNRRLTKT